MNCTIDPLIWNPFFQEVPDTSRQNTLRHLDCPNSSVVWTRAPCLGCSPEWTLSTKGRSRRRRRWWSRRGGVEGEWLLKQVYGCLRANIQPDHFACQNWNPHPLPAVAHVQTPPGLALALLLQSAHWHEVNTHKSEGDILWAAARIPNIHVSDYCWGQNSRFFSPFHFWPDQSVLTVQGMPQSLLVFNFVEQPRMSGNVCAVIRVVEFAAAFTATSDVYQQDNGRVHSQ